MCVHAGWILGACSGAEAKQRTQAPGSNPGERGCTLHAHVHVRAELIVTKVRLSRGGGLR